jgi:hypothetical protein
VAGDPTNDGALDRLIAAAEAAQRLPFDVDLWHAQNLYYRLATELGPERRARAVDGDPAAASWVARFDALGRLLQMSSDLE